MKLIFSWNHKKIIKKLCMQFATLPCLSKSSCSMTTLRAMTNTCTYFPTSQHIIYSYVRIQMIVIIQCRLWHKHGVREPFTDGRPIGLATHVKKPMFYHVKVFCSYFINTTIFIGFFFCKIAFILQNSNNIKDQNV